MRRALLGKYMLVGAAATALAVPGVAFAAPNTNPSKPGLGPPTAIAGQHGSCEGFGAVFAVEAQTLAPLGQELVSQAARGDQGQLQFAIYCQP